MSHNPRGSQRASTLNNAKTTPPTRARNRGATSSITIGNLDFADGVMPTPTLEREVSFWGVDDGAANKVACSAGEEFERVDESNSPERIDFSVEEELEGVEGLFSIEQVKLSKEWYRQTDEESFLLTKWIPRLKRYLK